MRGRGNSYPPHGRHINDAFPGLWPLRFRRSQLKLRRQQFWCCQLFFNCPFYGGQAPPPAYPASTPPSKPVRPRIVNMDFASLAPPQSGRARSLRHVSSSNGKRFAGLPFEKGRKQRLCAANNNRVCCAKAKGTKITSSPAQGNQRPAYPRECS